MSKTQSTADYASDEIVYIPRKLIHPDPDQPRVNADAELRASIESQGIIQAITVRPHPAIGNAFLIVDGERRYLGADKLAEIPCRIRLDLEDDADRLITQISANTGKPLSPIEQARAFKKILDAEPKLTQVKLANRLGIPRTTVGDRIRILDLAEPWQELLADGTITTSHVPALHLFHKRPLAEQALIACTVKDAVTSLADNGRTFEVAQFREHVQRWFNDLDYAQTEEALDAVLGNAPAAAERFDEAPDDDIEVGERPDARDAPEIQKAHRLAVKIERQRGPAKSRRKLERELHALPFWEKFRFASSRGDLDTRSEFNTGFWLFAQYQDANNREVGKSRPNDRGVAERFGVPHITSVVFRQGPKWFNAGSHAHSLHLHSLDFAVRHKVRVEAGELMGGNWGRSKKEQLKALADRFAEHRRGLIESIAIFSGIKRNHAEGQVDRYVAMIAADEDRVAQKAAAARERLAAEQTQQWEQRPRPSRAFTDTELVDGIAKIGYIEVVQIDKGRFRADTESGPYEGDSVREAMAVAIERYQVEPGAPIEGADDDMDDDDDAPWNTTGSDELVCIHCGCTEDNACEGGCSWITTDPPVCSQCQHVGAEKASELVGA